MTKAEAKKLVEENPRLAAEIIVAAEKLRDSMLNTRIPAGHKWSNKTGEYLDALGARLSLAKVGA